MAFFSEIYREAITPSGWICATITSIIIGYFLGLGEGVDKELFSISIRFSLLPPQVYIHVYIYIYTLCMYILGEREGEKKDPQKFMLERTLRKASFQFGD